MLYAQHNCVFFTDVRAGTLTIYVFRSAGPGCADTSTMTREMLGLTRLASSRHGVSGAASGVLRDESSAGDHRSRLPCSWPRGTITQLGVGRTAIPASGKSPLERVQQEHQRWLRWACAFRTGIEGRISVAKRRRCLVCTCCPFHGGSFGMKWPGTPSISHC